ncbi:MAG: PIN domain-containing protein [Bryobacterales bacterium]|nr:PIN domain-containing protein [Bryobacterales bacterium]
MIWLLDVNVLLALVDPQNLHHDRAHGWLASQADGVNWASCALTENGFCRLLSSTAYPGSRPPGEAASALAGLREGLGRHSFWPCDLSFADGTRFEWNLVQGAKQLTDLYLVALAVEHGGRLVTFDQRIRWGAVRGATESVICVL